MPFNDTYLRAGPYYQVVRCSDCLGLGREQRRCRFCRIFFQTHMVSNGRCDNCFGTGEALDNDSKDLFPK